MDNCEKCMRYTICDQDTQKFLDPNGNCIWYEDYYESCENCWHFKGIMCTNIDENGKCLGWKEIIKQ